MPTIQHLPISEMPELPGNATLDQILSLQGEHRALLHSWKKGSKGVFFLVMTHKATAIRAAEGISGSISRCQLFNKGPEIVRAHRRKLRQRRKDIASIAAK